MQNDTIRYLITQYVNGELTPAQQEELLQLLGSENETELTSVLKSMLEAESEHAVAIDPETIQPSLQKVLLVDKTAPSAGRVKAMYRYWSWVAAAVFIIIAGAIAVFTIGKKETPETVQAVPVKTDVQPGSNKAILTLANGQRIMLDSAVNGMLVQQGSAQVMKDGEGLKYEVRGQKSEEIAYNMLSTPKGGQYRLMLPDGSKVWLNAASSIRYPATFTGNERSVDITGEAYFEVTKASSSSSGGGGKKIPFIVNILQSVGGAREGRVEVLGTHFDINAYSDEEKIKTTLLEGKVKVTVPDIKSETVLMPGEQSVISPSTGGSREEAVDTEEAVAWTNDMFIFRDQDLESIMRQISRWYDVQVTYDKNVKNEKIVATISRNVPLSKVLHLLELTGTVHFKMNGKKIVVLP
jgi:ferric-dicitrate binding protein FerR (iron transport regulator)